MRATSQPKWASPCRAMGNDWRKCQSSSFLPSPFLGKKNDVAFSTRALHFRRRASTKLWHACTETTVIHPRRKLSTAKLIRLKAPQYTERGQIGAWNFLWSRFANGAESDFASACPRWHCRVWRPRFGMHGKLRSWSEQLFRPGITHEVICLLRAVNCIREQIPFSNQLLFCICIAWALKFVASLL